MKQAFMKKSSVLPLYLSEKNINVKIDIVVHNMAVWGRDFYSNNAIVIRIGS